MRRLARALAVAAGLLMVSGCAYPNRGDLLERFSAALGTNAPSEAYDPPRMRMGSMPFDAWYSPFHPVAVDQLGEHSYKVDWFDTRPGETSRGIIYTRRGGFLDVAHMRNTADLTWFVYQHVLAGYTRGEKQLRLVSAEPDVYVVRLRGPSSWQVGKGNPPPPQARRAARAIAGRLATLMTSWHELLTWYGYKGMGVITERPSAFSYDDGPSNRVGAGVAMRALAEMSHGGDGENMNTKAFDAAVTRQLAKTLRRLGAVGPEETQRRMWEVQGRWWSGNLPRWRVFDLAMEDQPVTPLVMDADADPVTWGWSSRQTVAGRRVSALYDVHIVMHTFQASAIDRALGIVNSRPVHPRTDFPGLASVLAKQVGQSP